MDHDDLTIVARAGRKSILRRAVVTLAVVGIAVAARIALEPRRSPARPLHLSPANRARISGALAASALDRAALVEVLARRHVLLVGESHFAREPQTFVADLVAALHARDGRRAVLLLELPSPMQDDLDRYLSGGDEHRLDEAWQRYGKFALPYQPIVRWARAHPQAVSGIVADDERPMRTWLMRLLLTDTRNATMAAAVTRAAAMHPADRIIVFGGRFHMMKSGRYLYDSPTRSPIGARLSATTADAPHDIAAIWLFAGEPPAGGTWSTPGAISFAGPAGALPIRVLEDQAVFGASALRQVADYAVYLGDATPVKG